MLLLYNEFVSPKQLHFYYDVAIIQVEDDICFFVYIERLKEPK